MLNTQTQRKDIYLWVHQLVVNNSSEKSKLNVTGEIVHDQTHQEIKKKKNSKTNPHVL